MDLFDKSRKDMEAEVKTSYKWVVLVAVVGFLVVLIFMSLS
jgi:signal transduction histidine kinase